jgi:type IV secretory pathway component VirB8
LGDVPPEHRATARIEINSEDNYGNSKTTIEFSYTRMETDDEESEREKRAAAQAEHRRAQELRTLAALQAKYGAPKT